ncbi:lysylphosphatidylglycerol synthase transmembrane domain-containing protein [Thalassorhabdomicrobium marinisediminis]|uniref:UPF0104 family protein n=1 Tax=Thalassorhabdomicrobium marinisediminis TaxID=2170577 RepID=A0A2T7FUD2_9RHOB|nr:lysylphosphatidylglycerol synthase transmembrane domain-containing protein [Thalassorhabdomicrobium marinisediminis]PVA05781.1 UPF0104 family protein [Thalassorhabdomicrobium marinisediminis]
MSDANFSRTALRTVTATVYRWRRSLLLAALLVALGWGLVTLVRTTGWHEIARQLVQLGPGQIVVLLLLSLANYLSRGLRWHLFVRHAGVPATLAQSLRHFIGGFALSVTPGRVGELVRMRWLQRETGFGLAQTAPLAVVDRASDLVAMALILLGSLALSTGGIAFAMPVAGLAVAAAVLVTRPTLLCAGVTASYRVSGCLPRAFARLRQTARGLGAFNAPSLIFFTVLLGACGWAAEGYAFHLLLIWLGTDIGAAKALAIFTFSMLAGGLTGAPGGLGGAEAAMIALLTVEGVPLEVSVPATAVIRATTLWFAIGLGALVFPVAERIAAKGAQS